jgi:predicted MFS family arabinose efflux permease
VFLIYSQSTGYLQLIPVQVLLAAAWSCLYVGALLLLLRNNEEKATATGILFSAVSLSGTVGPFLGGLVAQLWGYSALMYIAAGFSLAGLGLAAIRSR